MSEGKEYYPEYDGLNLQDLAKRMIETRDHLEELKKKQAEAQKRFDHLRKHRIPDEMENMGVETVKLTGVGRLSLRAEAYAGFAKGKQAQAIAWLEENGHGDIVKETVHNSTLKAFLKECVREGEELPEDLFSFTPYMQATITKS